MTGKELLIELSKMTEEQLAYEVMFAQDNSGGHPEDDISFMPIEECFFAREENFKEHLHGWTISDSFTGIWLYVFP